MRALIALMLASFTAHADGFAADISGDWATHGYTARVRVAPCADDAMHFCGTIVWLWEPSDAHGSPLRDTRNPRTELRHRALIGLPLLNDFKRDSAATQLKWIDGTIYDPESGRTYRATMTRRSEDVLEVEGCVLFVCRKQLWRRAASLCAP